jgi:hypothetical protein
MLALISVIYSIIITGLLIATVMNQVSVPVTEARIMHAMKPTIFLLPFITVLLQSLGYLFDPCFSLRCVVRPHKVKPQVLTVAEALHLITSKKNLIY